MNGEESEIVSSYNYLLHIPFSTILFLSTSPPTVPFLIFLFLEISFLITKPLSTILFSTILSTIPFITTLFPTTAIPFLNHNLAFNNFALDKLPPSFPLLLSTLLGKYRLQNKSQHYINFVVEAKRKKRIKGIKRYHRPGNGMPKVGCRVRVEGVFKEKQVFSFRSSPFCFGLFWTRYRDI